MKTAILLSIREKSTRLPGKVLKEINGKTVTELLIERIKSVNEADYIIIATSDDPRDKVFEAIAKQSGIECFFGDQDDKLKRYYQICKHYDLTGVVIVDGDDILCFPEVIASNIRLLKEMSADAIFWNNLPLGAASSALTSNALKRVLELKAENDTEVWGGYFINNPNFNVVFKETYDDLLEHPEVRMTLDYSEDFDFLVDIFSRLYTNEKIFTSHELMNYIIIENPEIMEITKNAQAKYEEHIKKAKPVKFK